MNDIEFLLRKVKLLEQRVDDLETQLTGLGRADSRKIVLHPMEAQRESISRLSLEEQRKHQQRLKDQLRKKSDL
jgi:hypothetical protein